MNLLRLLVHPGRDADVEQGAAIPKAGVAVFISLALLVGAELAVQLRSQWRIGQSVFAAVSGESNYQYDALTGLLLLRPSSIIGGAAQTIQSNRLGLRGPDLPVRKPESDVRLAVVGASSVMGVYAKRNEDTLPSLIEARLRGRFPSLHIDVINAGMTGLTIREQTRLLERLVLPYQPDLLILYPGLNDFGGHCRGTSANSQARPSALFRFRLPTWVLSTDLVLKNTVTWRDAPAPRATWRDPMGLDLSVFRQSINALIDMAERAKVPILVSTVARSFRPEQPLSEQLRLAESARYFNPCFNVGDLHRLHDRHNLLITEAARQRGHALIELDRAVPGGSEYFVDSGHFNERGDRTAANYIADYLVNQKLFPPTPAK